MPSDADKEKMYAEIGKKLPVQHVADAEECAEAYIFLMKYGFASFFEITRRSRKFLRCKYITGQRIDVDGGASLA